MFKTVPILNHVSQKKANVCDPYKLNTVTDTEMAEINEYK